ncbi:hypothetical protein [Chlamydia caviae]|uniref:Uncharacterized protein n=1 Tax=Chlamydia caviae (strain ATCC VR-813 / DSM 19441 / 03DC25 / GPIC) TaxID=227941 RepID=Q823Z6_CHLCV|nr:hypothetical protein [Chlamydia caviae]AAP05008.1 hypothetical protein CCA_00257 [Chlamydia caviae GPIC]
MKNKNTKKNSNIYLKKFIHNVIQFVDSFLEVLENQCKSFFSKEECDRALSSLIEDLQRYKDNLDTVANDPSNPLDNLVKLTEADLLK